MRHAGPGAHHLRERDRAASGHHLVRQPLLERSQVTEMLGGDSERLELRLEADRHSDIQRSDPVSAYVSVSGSGRPAPTKAADNPRPSRCSRRCAGTPRS